MQFRIFDKPLAEINEEDLKTQLDGVSEGWFVEYKSEKPTPKAIAKAVSGFADSHGGYLIIGVQADKESNEPIEYPVITDTLDKTSSRVITDDWTTYMRLAKRGVCHDVIAYGKGEYGHGDVHTNSIENLWSNIKRGLDGTYRHVSRKYRYLAEFVWKYNHREQKALCALVKAVSKPLVG